MTSISAVVEQLRARQPARAGAEPGTPRREVRRGGRVTTDPSAETGSEAYKRFTEVLDEHAPPFYTWFADGVLNVSCNCVASSGGVLNLQLAEPKGAGEPAWDISYPARSCAGGHPACSHRAVKLVARQATLRVV